MARRRKRSDDKPAPLDELLDLEDRWEQIQIREELQQFDDLADRIRNEEQ